MGIVRHAIAATADRLSSARIFTKPALMGGTRAIWREMTERDVQLMSGWFVHRDGVHTYMLAGLGSRAEDIARLARVDIDQAPDLRAVTADADDLDAGRRGDLTYAARHAHLVSQRRGTPLVHVHVTPEGAVEQMLIVWAEGKLAQQLEAAAKAEFGLS
jgi:hypothetical protein